MSVGAPPDEFNQLGQDWGQPPWHPHRLAQAAYRPFREMLAATLRHGGGLRMGLRRGHGVPPRVLG